MAKFGIGQSIRRVEDPRLLTGGGRYTDDTRLEGAAARAYVLRSPHAHADIRKIDVAAAAKAPGVLAVFTGDDVKKAGFGDVPSPASRREARGFKVLARFLTHEYKAKPAPRRPWLL